jgi:hypothetical protein
MNATTRKAAQRENKFKIILCSSLLVLRKQLLYRTELLFTKIIILFPLFNPNPHCFNTITKLVVSDWKEPILPHPLYSTVGGGACSSALKISVNYTHIINKRSLKLSFCGKPLKLKSLLKYFARHFWFFF